MLGGGIQAGVLVETDSGMEVTTPDALIEEGTHSDRGPVCGDVPHGEEAAQQQEARKCEPERVESWRVVELEELNRRCQNSRQQGNGRETPRGKQGRDEPVEHQGP